MGLTKKGNKIIAAGIVIVLVIALGIYLSKHRRQDKNALSPRINPQISAGAGPTAESKALDKVLVQGEIRENPAIDFKDLENDPALDALMKERKDRLGIKESLDLIVRSNEKFIVGGQKISMGEILEKALTRQGEVYQEEIQAFGGESPGKINEYGIYVVRPGDNIWNIHFNILKEYYAFRGIDVAPKADEPKHKGLSSGVGKILKFSETMVIIFNLIDRKVTEDINLLKPLSKVIVYNMKEIFSLLGEINYENVDQIQFDGRNIWIPIN